MLTDFFRSPQTLSRLRSGAVGAFIDGFAENLKTAGYSRFTIRAHLGAAAHFSNWAGIMGLTIAELDDTVGQKFQRHLASCQCRPYMGKYITTAAASVRLLRDYLFQIGAVMPHSPKNEETRELTLLTAFGKWMIQNRGVTQGTLNHYRPIIASFLESIDSDPCRIDSCSLQAFILDRTERLGKKNIKGMRTALRTFLRYLIAEGKCATGLDAALPAGAQWRLSTLPRYLPASDVERVVAACDASTSAGCRDRAIVLLLARLGLRGDDIVRLRISDIDWQHASVRLSGKGRREVRLPLTQEVGDSILDYLERGRPAVESDHVFIRTIAPLRPFSNSSPVSKVVTRAIRRAGIRTVFHGAHVLRHSAATEMLRQGISLQDIGSILRQRSIETTAHYAKVDVELLQLVAQPWPAVTSC